MNNLNFLSKTIYQYVKNTTYQAINFSKPQTCPHCDVNTDATFVSHSIQTYKTGDSSQIIIFIWRCTVCKKVFVSFHLLTDKQCQYLGMFPDKTMSFHNEQIEKVSPRFIEMYNQALRAESNNDFNLAAVGFRSAIEILIKDYAIVCLEKNSDEVAKLKLFKAIEEYLGEKDIIKTADVIRILGNDHTHYERKYPEHDFQLLKKYMDIFISMILVQIMIKYPPVSR